MIQHLQSQTKRALGIFGLFVITYAIGFFYWKNVTFLNALISSSLKGILVFAVSLFGLAYSEDLDFEPLPLVTNLGRGRKVVSWFVFTAAAFFLILLATRIVPSLVHPISESVLHENLPAENIIETHFGETPFFALFFLIFAGAGIAEEAIAMVVSSLIFGLYHLTPLDSLYYVFWEFPFYQVPTCTIIGVLLAYTYKKLGFESVVVIHTLINIF